MSAPRLILTLTGAMQLGPADLARLPDGLLELRLDRFDRRQIALLLGGAAGDSKPGESLCGADVAGLVCGVKELCPERELVVTCAPASVRGAAGGFAADASNERFKLLCAACAAGAHFVDIDPELAEHGDFASARVILSTHPEVAEEDLAVALDEALARGLRVAQEWPRVAALKIVPLTSSDDATQGVIVLDWLASHVAEVEAAGLDLIVFGAGAASEFTRTLATAFGSSAVYAAAAPDSLAPVPGQPTAAALVAKWPTGAPPARGTSVFGVLGHPVAGSLSPELFTRLFALSGCADAGVYERLDLADPGVLFAKLEAGAMAAVRGLSVTAPHKQAAWLFGSGSSRPPEPGLQRLGALNTLVRDAGVWSGANTDLDGVRRAAEELLGEPFGAAPRELVVIGAGGAARAVLAALGGPKWSGRALVLARDARRAMGLAREFGAGFGTLETLDELAPDLVVHTTPAGSHAAKAGEAWVPGARALAGLAERAPACCVLDANYAPDPTPLVAAARALGLPAAGGRTWFLAQALAQFERFAGVACEIGAARGALDELFARRSVQRGPAPVVLMGLRGAGKSTLGAKLATRLGRPFVDLDSRLAEEAGAASAGELFASLGEPEFRLREAALFEAVLNEPEIVVAAGGGLMTSRWAQAAFGAAGGLGLWLDARDIELARRVEADSTMRPALFGGQPEDEARRARAEREATFRRLAGEPIGTEGLALEDVLARLAERTAS